MAKDFGDFLVEEVWLGSIFLSVFCYTFNLLFYFAFVVLSSCVCVCLWMYYVLSVEFFFSFSSFTRGTERRNKTCIAYVLHPSKLPHVPRLFASNVS